MKILIVDDEAPIRSLLSQILNSQGHNCTQASNAESAEKVLTEKQFDLILSDINMPGKSGIVFVRDLLGTYPETAVIMVTAVVDNDLAESLIQIGVYDYITKPIDRSRVLVSIANARHRLELNKANIAYRERMELMVNARTISLKETLDKLENSLEGMVNAIAHIVETRDPYTAGHQKRVGLLARAIAVDMGISDEGVKGIYMGGIIHDVGKIAVPSEILSKPSRLTDIEFQLIKSHSQVGFDILKDIEFPWPIAEMVFQHHERFDGSGYPRGLSGEDILMEARILSVSDVVEAMASHRPYRAGLGIDTALAEIEGKMGHAYDATVAGICLDLFRKKNYQLEAPHEF